MIGGLSGASRYLLAGASAIAIWASTSSIAGAADVQQLEAAMQAMQAQMRALQQEVAEAKAAAAAAKATASSGGGDPLDLKVKWKGAPELSSADGKFKFKVRGRIMTDYNGIDQDQGITGADDISAVELRRARLGVEGVLFSDWKYKFEIDFAGDATEIKDAYLAYDFGKFEVRAGNFYTFNSLEQVTSSRFITFMERAAFTEAFFLDRQIGAALLGGGEHWSLQTGVYGAPAGEQETFWTDEMAATVRGTVAPINNDTTVLHMGASYRHRDAGELRGSGDTDLFEYRARAADLHLADRFVDTPDIGESDDLFVLEGAFVYKSFSVQGEYAQLRTDVAPSIADLRPTYDGWYVDASLFLTGEMRNYVADAGEFGRTKVKNPVYGGSGGWGAWQIAGRYDVIDLSDDAAAITLAGVSCSECGEQKTWLIGVNWWLTDYTALKLNVTQSEIEGGFNDGAEITGVGMRAQVDW